MTFFLGLCGVLRYQLEHYHLAVLLKDSVRADSVGYENLHIPGASRLGSLVECSSFFPQHPGATDLGPEQLLSEGGGNSCEKSL